MASTAEQLFYAAREYPKGEARTSFLRNACDNDAELRERVELLLQAEADAGAFLTGEPPPRPEAGPSRGVELASTSQIGELVGRYKLLQQIGEGGFGTVYLAEQQEPVKRRVALKIIKLGMDTRQVIARFESERQALAMMDHPSIAKVLDAGSTATGRPYFVMEYIEGVPIIEYSDAERLDTRRRLELFAKVCHAIQHAHQKGIIHRDIKPSNILIAMHDGRPVPKVIDFGIAKATSAELTARTLFTGYDQLIGTPVYMSPEQAEMTGADIDTRSDIYSLGVLLYELLTGTTPFDTREMKSRGFAEMIRIIREVEPHKPSTRLSSLSRLDPRDAPQRRAMDARRLVQTLRGDLDWIVMRCLEKDRARRYETANGLALEIERYLRGEPVLAAPPSASYRFRKFVRRNRGIVGAGIAVAASLLIGAIAFAWQAKVAGDQRDLAIKAQNAEAEQRKQADIAKSEALAQQAKAEAQESEAKQQAAVAEAVARFQTDMLSAADPDKLLGDSVTVMQVMQAAVSEIDNGSLKDQALVEAGVRDTISATFRWLARYAEAESNLRKSLEIRRKAFREPHPEIAENLNRLAVVLQDQNKIAEAESLYRDALEMQRAVLPAGHPDIAKSLNNIASVLENQNKLTEAEPLLREALQIRRAAFPPLHPKIAESLNNLARLLQVEDKRLEAEPLFREALESARAVLPAGHPHIAFVLSNLATLLQEQNRLAEAEPLYREALAIRRNALPSGHPEIASVLINLGRLLQDQNKLAEAELLFREALEIDRAALPADHPDIAAALNNLALLLNTRNEVAEAEPLFREALGIYRAARSEGHPNIATALNNLALLLQAQNRLAEAEPLFREALAIRRNADSPENRSTATALNNLARLLQAQNKLAEAEPLYYEALEMMRKSLPAGHPEMATALNNLASLQKAQNKFAEAEPLYREALAIRRSALTPGHSGIAVSLNNLAGVLKAQDRLAEAEPLYREALEIWRAALPSGHPNIAICLDNLAGLLHARNRLDEAEPLFREALGIWRVAVPPGHPSIAVSLIGLASLLQDENRFPEAESLFMEALEINRAALPAGHPNLLNTKRKLAGLYARQRKTDKALPLLRDVLESSRAALPGDSPELADQLAAISNTLLEAEAWADAEPLIRECLTIREKVQPGSWTTFAAMSMLGGALLGQNRLDDAEPLLLDGFRGMQDREDSIPTPDTLRISEALERLVHLYEARGNEAEAAEWRSKLEAARSVQAQSAANNGG